MPKQTHDLSFTATEVRERYVSWDRGEATASGRAGRCWPSTRRESRAGRCGARRTTDARWSSWNGFPASRWAAPLTPGQASALGRAPRRLYDIPLESIQAAKIAERLSGPTSLAGAVSEWLSESFGLAECRDPGLVAGAVDAAVGWLRMARLPEPRLVALGIADLDPANVLWDGRVCRLVDFQDGGLTDPAYELADHVEHLAGRVGGVFDPAALVEAVGLTSAERERMCAYRPLWAVYWLVMLLPRNGGFRRNPPGTTEAQATHLLSLLD